MAAVSALSLARPALRRIGAIGATETPRAAQLDTAFECLNGLIDTWSVLPQTRPYPVETVFTLPANTASRTIGDSMQVDLARPPLIVSAYVRTQGQDWPVDVATKQQYDSIDQKALVGAWPSMLWYDQGVPTGNLYFWPLAGAAVEVHITTMGTIRAFTDINDSQGLPGGAKRALILALAVELGQDFSLPVPDSLRLEAANAFRAYVGQTFEVPEVDLGGPTTTRLGDFLSGGF